MKTRKKRGRPAQKPLTIGVDAAVLGQQDKRVQAGVYTYARNLLHELARIDKKNTYILYSFSLIPSAMMRDFGLHMQNRVLPRLGWFRLWLPLALQVQQPDIFLALSQAVPRNAPPTVGVVYDIAFEHHPQDFGNSANALKKNTRELVEQAERIIAVSYATKADLEQTYRVDPQRIHVARAGVVATMHASGSRFVGTAPYFLFVGSLRQTKNIPLLLHAFAQFVNKSNEQYQLHLVGSDFWFDEQIAQTMKSLSLQRIVRIHGMVNEKKLSSLYRGATAVVLPSKAEGFGLPVVEAFACGVPVIASQIPALKEIVNSAGVLFEPGNVNALAQALHDVARDVNLQKKLRAAGIRRAKQFSWKKTAQAVLGQMKTVAYA